MAADVALTAQLVRPDGSVAREWTTTDAAAAMTAARNYPLGWRVIIK